MNIAKCLLAVGLFAAFGGAQAQLYKWVGPDGNVTYSDTPPTSKVAKVEMKDIGGAAVDTSNMPYELAQAVKNHPVVLYTTASCAGCDEGKKLLNARGIPFSEKTVNTSDDVAQLKKVGGETRLPFLLVGRAKQQGFQPDSWNTELTSAGYPASSQLPKDYRNPGAQSAAKPAETATRSAAKELAAEPARPESLPPAAGNAPPDFHF